ncbi:uncharacterized protein LOC131943176 [Physella acuta]|uniref:uncharacterized protein LOC131943176 n=1 Tax=Physella acuta TaxID=109671 RepID=UPI0027DE7980|nr:uncharacterized protein LOC131943176 [Physella acuta]
MTINRLHLQFNESALSENDTIKFVACNKTWEYNSFNRTLPRKLTCPRLEMEVRLTLGVFWLEIDAKGHFQINCILYQQDTEADRHTEEQVNRDLILVLVGVVAAVIISLVLGLCGVYVYRLYMPSTLSLKNFTLRLIDSKQLTKYFFRKFQKTDRPTPTRTEDSHSVGQAQPFNNESSPCVDTSTGTQPISPSADCYSLATLAVTANHDTDPNLTSVKLIDDCYSTCSVVTSQSDHDSHLSSRPDATSLPRHSHTPVADQQVVTSKHDAASKQCIDSVPRDLQTVEYHRKYQSSDDVYSNNQSEGDCSRFSAALQKWNSQSRTSNQLALDDSNTTPHQPPLANSTVYNSLNSLDGTYTHLKHVNPPERVIDNVYDG